MLSIEKCCFCVPRRLGLVVIGFLRATVSLLALWFIIDGMVGSRRDSVNSEPSNKTRVIIELPMIASFIVDVLFCGVLILAAKKSHLKIYKVFFHYSIVMACFTVVGAVIYCIPYDRKPYRITKGMPFDTIITFIVLITLVQCYIILLVRSEIMKIQKTQCWNPRSGRNVLM